MAVKSFRDGISQWSLLRTSICLCGSFQLKSALHCLFNSERRESSIPSNIAEGSGYGTNRRYVHHLRIACGSDSEVQTQLELAERLKLAAPSEVKPILEKASRVGRMLNGLIQSLDRHHELDEL
jgi:four helix bundle protein